MDIPVPDFKDIVPYLDNPLALVGYGLCLLFALFGTVVKAGGGKADASTRKFLYGISLLGAVVVLVVVVGGLTVRAMELAVERRDVGGAFVANTRADQSVTGKPLPIGDAKITRDQVDQAIALLQHWRADADAQTTANINLAIQSLRSGDAGPAVTLLSQRLDALPVDQAGATAMPAQTAEAVAVARAIGGLAFLADTRQAKAAYELLVRLAPGDWVAWNQLALLQLRTGDYTKAVVSAQKVRDIGQASGDKAVVARGLGLMGVAARQRSHLDEAVSLSEQAVGLLRASGDQRGLAIELGNLGIVKRMLGEYDAAEKLHKEALAIEKQLDDSLGIAREYGNLGSLLLVRGKAFQDQAEDYIDLSLRFNRQAGSRIGIAMRLNQLGEFAMRRGEWDAARARFEEVQGIAKDLGDRYDQAIVLSNLARVYKLMAENQNRPELYAKAEQIYHEAMDIDVSLDDRIGQSIIHARLGRLYFRRQEGGDVARAKDQLEAALAISQDKGHKRATIDYLRTYGEVLLALHKHDDACTAWRKAISLQKELGLGPNDQKWFEDKLQAAGCGT